MFDLSELMRQTDSVHTLNVNYLYCLNKTKGEMKTKWVEIILGMNHPVQ